MFGSPARVAAAYRFWCWRLRVPMVWFERQGARSRYGRLHLDLTTTHHLLSEKGQEQLNELMERFGLKREAVVSPFEGVWDDVPVRRIEEFAHSVFRIATRLRNYELHTGNATAEIARIFAEIASRQRWRMTA
jgi:hypothetical protein